MEWENPGIPYTYSPVTGVPPYSGVNNLNVVGNPTGEFPLARSIA